MASSPPAIADSQTAPSNQILMGLALMTNMAAGMSAEALTHALTLQQAAISGERAAGFLAAVVAGLAELPSLHHHG